METINGEWIMKGCDSSDPSALLIDSWKDQEAIDAHHASPIISTRMFLRERRGVHACKIAK